MKNLVAVLLSLALIVSFTACASYSTDGYVVTSASCEEPLPEVAKVIKIKENVMFDWDSYAIRADQTDILDAVAAYMAEYPETTLALKGHASEEGATDYNLDLSANRAEAVRGALYERGVEPARIVEVMGVGETTLFGELLELNRRVLVLSVD